MAGFKVLMVLAVVAVCAVAAAVEKKDVMMMTSGMKYANDDGSYWPGKYERSMMPAYHGMVPAMAPVHAMPIMQSGMFPYAYTHMPVSRAFVV